MAAQSKTGEIRRRSDMADHLPVAPRSGTDWRWTQFISILLANRFCKELLQANADVHP
ncbi:MAG: hypothetical protein ACT6R2_20280 [Blastomonas fulva]|uniref:hypothetical protein n=1 Tax=Blastomonas fulva TaxID=1550728 RepID=UPI0012E226CE